MYTVCLSSHAEPKSMILMTGLSRLEKKLAKMPKTLGRYSLFEEDVFRLEIAMY